MFQTTFPYLIKEEHLKNDTSVLEKRKLYVKSGCNLYHMYWSSPIIESEALIDEYENKFAEKMIRAKFESALKIKWCEGVEEN